MRNKFFAAFFAGLFLFLSAPTSSAADIPLLTWERGKEQNLVLGGKTLINNWKITLNADGKESLAFSRSSINASGFIVYYVQIPKDFPLGVYTIQTEGSNSPKTTVAGVNVIQLLTYNIVQMPGELLFLVVIAAFLSTAFSVIRRRRYSPLYYLRSRNLLENPYDERFAKYPRILRSVYRMRIQAVDNLRKSLFKFALLRDGEFLHKISPVLWAILPIASLFIGFFAGAQSRNAGAVVEMPIILFGAISVLGVLDSYSGFIATIGFALFQIMGSNVTTIKDALAVMAIAIAWCAPGLISTMLVETTARDFGINRYSEKKESSILVVIAAVVGAMMALVSQMITSSLTGRVGSFFDQKFLVPGILVLMIMAKRLFENSLDQAHQGKDWDSSYREISLDVARVVSPQAVLVIFTATTAVTYIWTHSVAIGVLTGALWSVPFLFLLVRFTSPSVSRIDRLPRNILAESAILGLIVLIEFLVISRLPFEVNLKSEFLLVAAAVPLIIHSFFNAVTDSQSQERGALI